MHSSNDSLPRSSRNCDSNLMWLLLAAASVPKLSESCFCNKQLHHPVHDAKNFTTDSHSFHRSTYSIEIGRDKVPSQLFVWLQIVAIPLALDLIQSNVIILLRWLRFDIFPFRVICNQKRLAAIQMEWRETIKNSMMCIRRYSWNVFHSSSSSPLVYFLCSSCCEENIYWIPRFFAAALCLAASSVYNSQYNTLPQSQRSEENS